MSEIQKIKSFIQTVDLFSEDINFSYQNKKEFKTVCGGITSLFVFFLLLFYFLYLLYEMKRRNNITILSTNYVANDPLFISIIKDTTYESITTVKYKIPDYVKNHTFYLQTSFGIIDTSGNLLIIDKTIFNLEVNQVIYTNNSVNIMPIPTFLCPKFDVFAKEYDALNLNLSYCINSNFQLYGIENSKNYSKLLITLKRCQNSTTSKIICKSVKNIDNYIDGLKINIYYTSSLIDPTNFESPIYNSVSSQYWDLISPVRKNTKSYLSIHSLISYDEFLPIFFNSEPSKYYALVWADEEDSVQIIDSPIFFQLDLFSSSKFVVFQRSYEGILVQIAAVGGITKLVVFIGYLIVFYFVDFYLKESISNDLYNIIDPENHKFLGVGFHEYIKRDFNFLIIDKIQDLKKELKDNIVEDRIQKDLQEIEMKERFGSKIIDIQIDSSKPKEKPEKINIFKNFLQKKRNEKLKRLELETNKNKHNHQLSERENLKNFVLNNDKENNVDSKVEGSSKNENSKLDDNKRESIIEINNRSDDNKNSGNVIEKAVKDDDSSNGKNKSSITDFIRRSQLILNHKIKIEENFDELIDIDLKYFQHQKKNPLNFLTIEKIDRLFNITEEERKSRLIEFLKERIRNNRIQRNENLRKSEMIIKNKIDEELNFKKMLKNYLDKIAKRVDSENIILGENQKELLKKEKSKAIDFFKIVYEGCELNQIEYIEKKILFDLIKYDVYKGINFSIFEILKTCFCLKKIKNSYQTFKEINREINPDNPFINFIKMDLENKYGNDVTLYKKFRIFQISVKKFTSDFDIVNILQTVKDYKRFLKLYFDEIQLNLFQSFSNPVITILDVLKSFDSDIDSMNSYQPLNLSKLGTLKTFKINEYANDIQLKTIKKYEELLENITQKTLSLREEKILQNLGVSVDSIIMLNRYIELKLSENNQENIERKRIQEQINDEKKIFNEAYPEMINNLYKDNTSEISEDIKNSVSIEEKKVDENSKSDN